jgi:hypothetical protein
MIAVNVIHMRHAQIINQILNWDGHPRKGRSFSIALDESHFWHCLRYIERNPVHAGLVKKVQDYPWSSAATHCGLKNDPTLAPGMAILEKRGWTSCEVKKPVFIGERIGRCPLLYYYIITISPLLIWVGDHKNHPYEENKGSISDDPGYREFNRLNIL